MSNEVLIRNLIKGSLQRAIQESLAAILVLVAFAIIFAKSEFPSLRFYGCSIILMGAVLIVFVVWTYALSYDLLQKHPSFDLRFWRSAFKTQSKLLRLVPVWYCGPLFFGCMLFVAPTVDSDLIPFMVVAAIFTTVFAGIIFLNRRAASKIDEAGSQLTAT